MRRLIGDPHRVNTRGRKRKEEELRMERSSCDTVSVEDMATPARPSAGENLKVILCWHRRARSVNNCFEESLDAGYPRKGGTWGSQLSSDEISQGQMHLGFSLKAPPLARCEVL